ncbi:hypothetical protein AK812_SmicGene45619, partial [Symbiodinium microadriaticum]
VLCADPGADMNELHPLYLQRSQKDALEALQAEKAQRSSLQQTLEETEAAEEAAQDREALSLALASISDAIQTKRDEVRQK